jgi:amino acid adenylation domain-containing protein
MRSNTRGARFSLLSDSLEKSSLDEQCTIAVLLDEQMTRTPEATALVFGDVELTYRQLQERVDTLAQRLQNIGVEPESLVGVFMNRSVAMVVAVLAVLKAGGAYVPLDPAHPRERIALIIDDCRARAILTTEPMHERLPANGAQLVLLNDQAAIASVHGPLAVSCPAHSANLAYVIHTSGSTGKPKGVMVEHRNVLGFFAAMDRLLGTEPGVWLAVTSISFDISVLELLWTLARGFTVVLHGDLGTDAIASEILTHRVTHFQSTPSLAGMLATDPRSLAALGSLKKLLLGGEALPVSLVRSLRGGRATGEIYNMYGPTETTVWSTAYCIPDIADCGNVVPIGEPLGNTRAYILDPDLQLVSEGEPGELFLGGFGVVRGYREQPELTALRFLPDRFTGEGFMYRTGDVVRARPDGNLEFLGRTDFQVKLRGHRIELGEIEAVLEQQRSVSQTVVVAREDRPGDKRLVAYVVARAGEPLTPATCRAALESRLPAYMVPSHFVFLDRLPLTPNGKIDRKALPAIHDLGPAAERAPSSGEGPYHKLECLIVKSWREALGVEEIGLNENVFDLGATSLMMPQVQMELQRELGRDIPLVDLFEFHTVKALAAHFGGVSGTPRKSDRALRRLAARRQEGPG